MEKVSFGTTKDGLEVSKYVIKNSKGMKVVVTDFGATVISIFVKDKEGNDRDVVLGYDDLASYENECCYFGATVGRYANRIADAKVTIDGVEYPLEQNDNENSLHSGSHGVSKFVWAVTEQTENKITFETVSKDLEQGFPGNCTIAVTYEVTEENELKISYHAVSDKKTMINLTNHSYFNLAGHENGDVLDQELMIKASGFTPVKNGKAIPTGEVLSVKGTPFDFTESKTIGRDIAEDYEQLIFGNGYDHNFAIDNADSGVQKIATAYCSESGILMDTYTDLPGVQLYTANFVGGQKGKGNASYVKNSAFCLETQYYPNAANEPNFKTPLFDADEACDTVTIYKFSVK